MIFQMLKEKTCQLIILHSAKLSFRIEGETKSFPDKRRGSSSLLDWIDIWVNRTQSPE